MTVHRAAFGKSIKRHRQILGQSQEEFAAHCGLHRTYIGSVERGKRNVSIDNMLVIAHGLGMSLSLLVQKAEEIASS